MESGRLPAAPNAAGRDADTAAADTAAADTAAADTAAADTAAADTAATDTAAADTAATDRVATDRAAAEIGEYGSPAARPETGAGKRPTRGREGFWTKARESQFFDHLGMTGNVSAAVQSVGLSQQSAYYRQRTNEAFAASWAKALVAGYQTIEARMIAEVLEAEPFDWDKAQKMLSQRAGRAGGRAGGRAAADGAPPTVAKAAETDTAIHRALAALARRRARAGDPGPPPGDGGEPRP